MAYIHDSPDPEKAVAAELGKVLGATPAVAELLVKALIEALTDYATDAHQQVTEKVAALDRRLDAVLALCGQPPPGGPPRQTMANRAFRTWPPP